VAAGFAVIAERIAEHHEGWPGPFVEDEVFGTHEPVAVAAALQGFLGPRGDPTPTTFPTGSVRQALAIHGDAYLGL
jgi:hypothetical protein